MTLAKVLTVVVPGGVRAPAVKGASATVKGVVLAEMAGAPPASVTVTLKVLLAEAWIASA